MKQKKKAMRVSTPKGTGIVVDTNGNKVTVCLDELVAGRGLHVFDYEDVIFLK